MLILSSRLSTRMWQGCLLYLEKIGRVTTVSHYISFSTINIKPTNLTEKNRHTTSSTLVSEIVFLLINLHVLIDKYPTLLHVGLKETEHVALWLLQGANILVPCHVFKSRHFIGWSGTRSFICTCPISKWAALISHQDRAPWCPISGHRQGRMSYW